MNSEIASKATEVERLLAELRELVSTELPGVAVIGSLHADLSHGSGSTWFRWVAFPDHPAIANGCASGADLPTLVQRIADQVAAYKRDHIDESDMLAAGFDRVAMGC